MSMTTRLRIVPDPLVRAAGYALLAFCGSWMLVFLLFRGPWYPGQPPVGTVELAALVLLCALAVGMLRGSRRLALAAIAVLALLTLGDLLVPPLNVWMLVQVALGLQRLTRLERPPFWPGWNPAWLPDRAASAVGTGSVLASAAGAVWVAVATTGSLGNVLAGSGPITIGLLLVAPTVVAADAAGLMPGAPGWAVAATAQLAVLAGLAASAAERAGSWWPAGWVLVDVLLLVAVAGSYARLCAGER